jgi:hypothetical protein
VKSLDDVMGYGKFFLRQIYDYLPRGAVEYLTYHITRYVDAQLPQLLMDALISSRVSSSGGHFLDTTVL